MSHCSAMYKVYSCVCVWNWNAHRPSSIYPFKQTLYHSVEMYFHIRHLGQGNKISKSWSKNSTQLWIWSSVILLDALKIVKEGIKHPVLCSHEKNNQQDADLVKAALTLPPKSYKVDYFPITECVECVEVFSSSYTTAVFPDVICILFLYGFYLLKNNAS